MQRPILENYEGVTVVRDDLLPGGTKSRFILPFLKQNEGTEFVYATPPEGGAQVALAICAYQTGKQATLFVAKRRKRTAYTQKAADYGARIIEISPGWLNVVQARAQTYAKERNARLLPFGLNWPEAIKAISDAAYSINYTPDEVWCAAGSGVLSQALKKAWPLSDIKTVQVGKNVENATHIASLRFGQKSKLKPPFPSNPFYDAKAWDLCQRYKGKGNILFWNVAG
ncbi:MAG: hypothetical protein HWE34_04495 [Methylocystaceae bacterium]|nr:hypothetical protein [Methylocystaceae bacterium]